MSFSAHVTVRLVKPKNQIHGIPGQLVNKFFTSENLIDLV